MDDTKDGRCQNPDCVKRAKQYKEMADKYSPIGQDLLERFLKQEDADEKFGWGNHTIRRSLEKSINLEKLFGICEQDAWVINYSRRENSALVHGSEKIGKGKYRHYHIPIIFTERQGEIKAFVKTVYDPKASSHLWDKSLSYRLCWCQPYELS